MTGSMKRHPGPSAHRETPGFLVSATPRSAPTLAFRSGDAEAPWWRGTAIALFSGISGELMIIFSWRFRIGSRSGKRGCAKEGND
ncbi:hypothetical protein JOD54_006172 [Actinokineospora baliensis]|uniref:hypothetical protein n=1 Tax=Actinokineospora baliensis TaxID=547056 RepID=UPI00195E346B|nr:hypothetical protein [Actinokineospora baliensis]MBM7775968.1 hypothetical protein [Actinokineospora baliensis]